MSNTILIKRSGTPNAVPASGNLSLGELAINYADGNLFYKDNTNAVKIIASNQFVSVTGNVTANNGIFTTIVNTASFTGGIVSVTGNITGANLNATGLSLSGNVLSALNSTSNVTTTANISANYVLGNGYYLTGVITSVANINNGTSNVTVVSSGGNITVGVGGTGNVVVFATTGEYITGLLSATGNITGSNVVTGGLITATGNITSSGNISAGNILTGGLISATGNISTGANVGVSGYVTVVGNVISGNVTTTGLISAQGNVTGGNVNTVLVAATTVSATGNVNGGNVNTNNLVGTALTISSTGALNLSPSGNVVLTANTWINNLAYPVQDQDAASKLYVDTVAQGLAVKTAANAATTTDLATWLNIPAGNVTYNQPNGAGNGVGATLTFVGNSLTALDGQVVTSGQRLLIKNQSNAATNGTYTTTANLFVITRSNDMDQSAEFNGAFLFVTKGSTNGDTSWVQITDNVVVGTSNVVFTQFSGAGTYTAGNGLSLNGTQFNVNTDGNIGINGSNQVYIVNNATINNPNITAATGTSVSVTGNLTGANLTTSGILVAAKGVQNSPIGNAIANTGAFTTLTANGIVTFTSNVATSNYLDGAVRISGGVGIAGNIELPSTSQIHMGSELAGTFAGAQLLMVSNVNSYSQAVKQNISNGASASSDFVAVANNGDDSTFYIDMGINSNNYSDVNYTATAANDGYLYVNGGNLVIGTQTTGKNIVFHAGNTLSANIVAVMSYTNLTLSQSTVSTSVGSGALILSGTNAGLGVAGNIYAGGLLSVTGNINGGNLNTTGTLSTSGNIAANNVIATTIVSAASHTGGLVSVTGNITSGNISTAGNVNGANVVGTIVSATGNVVANNVIATTISNAASFTGGIVSVTGNVTGGNLTTAGTGNVATLIVTTFANVTATTISTNSTSGAMIVAGGLGVAGNIYGGALYDNGTAVLTINSTVDGGTY